MEVEVKPGALLSLRQVLRGKGRPLCQPRNTGPSTAVSRLPPRCRLHISYRAELRGKELKEDRPLPAQEQDRGAKSEVRTAGV